MKRFTRLGHGITVAAIVAVGVLLAWPASAAQVTLQVSSTVPEWFEQERAIWDLYEDENPNIKIDLFPINEDTEAAYQARVAAGDPADIRVSVFPNLDNYKTYYDMRKLNYAHWDKLTYDGKTVFQQAFGVPYQPSLNVKSGHFFSFIFHADGMRAAGLDPKKDVRSLQDLEKFLDKLKAHVDKNPDLDYVFDHGWHPVSVGRWFFEAVTYATGKSKVEIRDLFSGKIQWTDLKNNPYVPMFELVKKWGDKGYFPEKWWLRAWETEFEAGFVAKKSLLTFHGPWLWNKVLGGNPDAELDAFPMPTAHPDKLVMKGETTSDEGGALYTVNKGNAEWDEAVKAFLWWNSPEIVRLRAEAIGFVPAMNIEYELETPQYVQFIKPFLDGKFGPLKFDGSLAGEIAVGGLKKSGKPRVMEDNAVVPIIGDYLSGKTSMAQFMAKLQARWEESYGK